MKLLFLCAATALAAGPPRIELNLDGIQMRATKLSQSIWRAHHSHANVMSRQDYSAVCEASVSLTEKQCPFPVAKAYDHMSGDISDQVKTNVFLVDVDGHSCGTDAYDCKCDDANDSQCKVSVVNFSRRSTYLFKYDVTDAAGNHAEQVVFSLILNDVTKPVIRTIGALEETWEAASKSYLDTSAIVEDPNGVDVAYFGKDKRAHLLYDIVKSEVHESTNMADWLPVCKNQAYSDYVSYKEDGAFSTKKDVGGASNNVGSVVYDYAANSNVPCASIESGLSTKIDATNFIVTFHVCDNARVYGVNGQSNCISVRKAIKVRDTLSPTVRPYGTEPTYQQCHYKDRNSKFCMDQNNKPIFPKPKDCHRYVDEGAEVFDQLDTESMNRNLETACEGSVKSQCTDTWGEVDSSVVGKYTINYRAFDKAGNPKQRCLKAGSGCDSLAKRTVEVIDTVAPTTALRGIQRMTIEASTPLTQLNLVDMGAKCTDNCKRSKKDDGSWEATQSWVGRPYNPKVPGEYVRKYTCDDGEGQTSHVTRTFFVDDVTPPTITVAGEGWEVTGETWQALVVEASKEQQDFYEDAGAECHDNVDDDISAFVVVGGDVVDRKTPGTYRVSYDCTDRHGRKAVTQWRSVIVKDTQVPTLARVGSGTLRIEAGFDYEDQGAIASDSLDGDLTNKVVTTGNQVNTIRAFTSKRSCAEIKASYPAASTGDYYIAAYLTTTSEWTTTQVFCEMSQATGHTFKIVTQDSLCDLYRDDQCACGKYGLDMPKWSANLLRLATSSDETHRRFANMVPPQEPSSSSPSKSFSYICGLKNEGADRPLNPHPVTLDTVSHAMPGKYVIEYSVTDAAGNTNVCATAENTDNKCMRTVVVTDTLKPVISLHLSGKKISPHSPAKLEGCTLQAHDPGYKYCGGHTNGNNDISYVSELDECAAKCDAVKCEFFTKYGNYAPNGYSQDGKGRCIIMTKGYCGELHAYTDTRGYGANTYKCPNARPVHGDCKLQAYNGGYHYCAGHTRGQISYVATLNECKSKCDAADCEYWTKYGNTAPNGYSQNGKGRCIIMAKGVCGNVLAYTDTSGYGANTYKCDEGMENPANYNMEDKPSSVPASNPQLENSYSAGIDEETQSAMISDSMTFKRGKEMPHSAFAMDVDGGDWQKERLMAEQEGGHSAWLLAAIASAVAGVALLAHSQRQQRAIVVEV